MDIKILKYEYVEWEKLKSLQPDDFKNISEIQLNKLKKSIRNNGFKSPFFVWENKKTIWTLDGHTRIPILKLLKNEGEIIPDKLPAVFIDCKNKEEAKKAILIYNSHYADINKESMFDFISDLNFDELKTEIELKELNFDLQDDIVKESTICKSDREKRQEIDVEESERDIEIHEWIDSFNNILVMFSGGKDSMALVADLLDNGIKKDKITLVFNLTPLDYPDLKEFVIEYAKNNNLNIDIIGEEKTESEKQEMFERNGFPLPYMSWCTGTWKVQPLNKYIKEKCSDKNDFILCQGWRREESEFRASSKDRVIHGVHGIRMARPILDYTESQVYDIIKKHKWQLHRAYKYYKRLGCIYCFSKTREEWDLMRENDPETFLRAMSYVSDGMMSSNISLEYGFNAIRKMMGKETINERNKVKSKKK